MLKFFPEPFHDEILFSLIARYHSGSGNINLKNTLYDIFASENVIATVEFPSRLDYLEKALPKKLGFSSDYFINKHTIYPVYAPFLPNNRRMNIQQEMKYKDGRGIKTKVGMIAGSIRKKDSLMYCSDCAKEDIDTCGEAYFHRLHQVEGVIVCPKHKCFLKNYNIKKTEVSRIEYIKFCPNNNDLKDVNYIADCKLIKLIDIAYGVEYLLDNCLINYNMNKVHDKYIELLNNRGLVTLKGRIKQRELYEEFISFYPTELLTQLNSSINFDNECNWLKVALRKPKRVIHPIRNILIILFLSRDLESFFKEETHQCSKQALFPCLNPACENYRKLAIKKYDISIDSKTNEKIGTFYCKCEFVYSREMEADIYVVGRVKKYGVTWETKLKGLISEGKYSTRGIALILRCDSKTVVRYADKLGMKHLLNTNMNVTYDVINASSKRINYENYKMDIKNIIIENPTIIRKQVRDSLNKQYMWLYKNDREWFDSNMPKKQNTNGNNNNNPAPWNERDNKTLELLINEDNMLITSNDNVRITKSLLGRKIGMLGMIEKNLDKLPKTQKYLSEIIESVEDFQIRRVNNICLKLYENGERLAKWKIVRQVGLRANYSIKVDEQIDINLLKYNKLNE